MIDTAVPLRTPRRPFLETFHSRLIVAHIIAKLVLAAYTAVVSLSRAHRLLGYPLRGRLLSSPPTLS
jgi:hypothetical protein